MKPIIFNPSLMAPASLAYAGLRQESINRQQGVPTISSILNQRLNPRPDPQLLAQLPQQQQQQPIRNQEQPVSERQQRNIGPPIMEEEDKEASDDQPLLQREYLPIETQQQQIEMQSLFNQIPIQQAIPIPELEQQIAVTNPELNAEQIRAVATEYDRRDAQQSQENVNRAIEESKIDDQSFIKWMGKMVVKGILRFVTFEMALNATEKIYNIYKNNKIYANLKKHDGVIDKDYSQDEFKELIQKPIKPQCRRHVYADRDGKLRSILVCTDQFGQRTYLDR